MHVSPTNDALRANIERASAVIVKALQASEIIPFYEAPTVSIAEWPSALDYVVESEDFDGLEMLDPCRRRGVLL